MPTTGSRGVILSGDSAADGTSARRSAYDVVPWSAPCPPIDAGRILRVHGYTDPSRIRPVIRKVAAAMATRAPELADARGSWRRVQIEAIEQGSLKVGDGTTFSCAPFDRLLAGASEVVAFVLTLGPAFDAAVGDRLAQSEVLEALFLETAGRLAIEKLTRVLAFDIGAVLAPEGLSVGTRIGPGYSYRSDGASVQRVMWPLEQQRELFGLFGSAAMPVELMSSAVMRPKMSRSGLLALRHGA